MSELSAETLSWLDGLKDRAPGRRFGELFQEALRIRYESDLKGLPEPPKMSASMDEVLRVMCATHQSDIFNVSLLGVKVPIQTDREAAIYRSLRTGAHQANG